MSHQGRVFSIARRITATAYQRALAPIALLLLCLAAATLFVSRSWSAAAVPAPGGPVRFTGVNLAGGEFKPEKNPGILFKDYIYPDARTAAPFVAMGMNSVRMPIRWERIQRSAYAPLDPGEMRAIDKSISALGGFSLIVVDVHNYAKYRGKRLDSYPDAALMFADLWTRLAKHYGSRSTIAFGLMNEPAGIDARAWRRLADAATIAIRRQGARNLILVPGTRWTGAHSWMQGGVASNAAAFEDFRDPGGNFAFEMHQYVDRNSSGTGSDCVSAEAARDRLAAATRWLRARKARALLGEFGAPGDPACLAALGGLLAFMDENSDAWLGWTYWAGGSWWKNYAMNIQPERGAARPQARVLARYIRPRQPAR